MLKGHIQPGYVQDIEKQINICVYIQTHTNTFLCMHLSAHSFVHREAHENAQPGLPHTYTCRNAYTFHETCHDLSIYIKIQPAFQVCIREFCTFTSFSLAVERKLGWSQQNKRVKQFSIQAFTVIMSTNYFMRLC